MKTKTLLLQIILILAFIVCSQFTNAQSVKTKSINYTQLKSDSKNAANALSANTALITSNNIAWANFNVEENIPVQYHIWNTNNVNVLPLNTASIRCRCTRPDYGCGLLNQYCKMYCSQKCWRSKMENVVPVKFALQSLCSD